MPNKEQLQKQINSDLSSFDIDDVKTNGITIRAGSKILKFDISEENDLSTIEEEIRNEYKLKVKEKLNVIKEKVSEKMIEMSNFINQLKNEYELKESKLKRKLKNSVIMPEVTLAHAEQGLSIVKGSRSDEIYWLVNGIYWPKFINKKPIEIKFSKKMISNIIFMIKTKKDKVVGVTTRRPIGMEYFQHYHQNDPDCWGDWHPEHEKYKSPNDIIKIARKAEALLEYINNHSIAKNSPRGLPRISTVKNHLITIDESKNQNMGQLNQQVRRSGITQINPIQSPDILNDVWST